jgi:glutamate synthase domain-containing protein 1
MSDRKKRVNYYPHAIEILTAGRLDAQAMCTAFAKYYPATFVKVAGLVGVGAGSRYIDFERYHIDMQAPWYAEARSLMRDGRKLEAIKLARNNVFGMTLVDAKNFIEQKLL